MSEFFKPWRRRFGVLTLAISLLLMGGWIRSRQIDDVRRFNWLGRRQLLRSVEDRLQERERFKSSGKNWLGGNVHPTLQQGGIDLTKVETHL